MFFPFFFHLPHCLHCSGAFSGHYTATRSCSRTLLFSFYNFFWRFYKTQEFPGLPIYKRSPHPLPFVPSTFVGRLSTVSNASPPPLRAFTNPIHASCSCMCMVIIREEERLVRRAAFLHCKSRHRLRTNRCK